MVDMSAVLEGDFAVLCNIGLPFPISYQLHQRGLKIPDELWAARSSATGFSVSLFRPSNQPEILKGEEKKEEEK